MPLGPAMLTPETITKIKRLHRQGKTPSEISKKLGCCKTTVWYHTTEVGKFRKRETAKPTKSHRCGGCGGLITTKKCLACEVMALSIAKRK